MAGAVSLWSQSQSLADLAREERARRANTKSKYIVTTDLVKAAAPAATTQAKPATEPDKPAAESGTKPVGPTDNKGRDEKWWRETFASARSDLKRSEDRMRVLQLELNRANRDYLQRSDVYNREMRIANEIISLNAQMDAERNNADTARRKIAELEEELRRSGGPAGWAR
jgi:hypothetical protein